MSRRFRKSGRRALLNEIAGTSPAMTNAPPRSAQAVLAEQLHGACLRSLVAQFLKKRDADAGRKLPGAAIEDAVLVKIDFAAVGSLQEAEAGDVVEAPHGRNRRAVMGLDLA